MAEQVNGRADPSRGYTPWIVFIAVAGTVAVGLTLAIYPYAVRSDVALLVLLLGLGMTASALLPIRFRIAGATHGVTADEAFLVAMLVALPAGLPALVALLGLLVGHLWRRTPPERLLFNVGLMGLSASAATAVFQILSPTVLGFSLHVVMAAVAAMVVHAVVSALFIGDLFRRLGVSTFGETLRDLLPVTRVTLPASIAGGLLLGLAALRSALDLALGISMLLVLFVAYRAVVGVRLQRDRAARLRDVALALVTASGSLDAFDEALGQVATLFGAASAELHVDGAQHRLVEVGSGRIDGSTPSEAAIAALALSRAQTYAPGTRQGGSTGTVAAPMVRDGHAVGALVLHARRGLEPWQGADEDVLDGIAGEVLVALQNAELVEQIAAERTLLSRQTDLLGGILEAASDGIALVDTDGQILAWNPAMATLAGTGNQYVVGRLWRDVLRATDDQRGLEGPVAAFAAAAGGRTMAQTWRVEPTTGEDRWVRVVLSPASAGVRNAVVLIAHDVTAVREVDRLKADFLATVSHELRTPLTPLKGFLELDAKRSFTPEQRAEMSVSMRRQVARLEDLIDDLLAMAELDKDLVDVAHDPFDLREAVTRVHLRHVATGRIVVQEESVVVIGDIDAAVRIIDAVVDNAIKHTEGAVTISITADGATGIVTVLDHGEGIAVSDQERIFERFARLGDHLLRKQGPGLGLPIARALARRLDGDVTVESRPGDGSSFKVWLPLA